MIGWRELANNLTPELQPRISRTAPFSSNRPFQSLPLPSVSLQSFTMASRRLAFNFNQALRSRAALKAVQPVKRGFASPVALPSTTQSTTLSNGFTVRKLIKIHLNGFAIPLIDDRLPLNTPHGLRHPLLASGSTPAAEQRLTRPTEPHISLSTLLSRYILSRYPGSESVADGNLGYHQEDSAPARTRDREHGCSPERLHFGTARHDD